MEVALLLVSLAGAAVWVGVLLVPWRPWLCRETLEPQSCAGFGEVQPLACCSSGKVPGLTPESSDKVPDLTGLTAVIPARNEATVIAETLGALAAQGRGLRIVVVDDDSSDGTAEVARRAGHATGLAIEVVEGEPLPAGWTGKLWALEQGTRRVPTPLTLLLDADIALAPGMIAALFEKRKQAGAALVSLMVTPEMPGFWEKLLMPAFVYFFKLLYPFALSNARESRVAAAAGGCLLIETRLLSDIGGPAAIRGQIIDDCALAQRVKVFLRQELRDFHPAPDLAGEESRTEQPKSTWIGLSHGARSLRAPGGVAGIWNMVARTAFAQLRHSVPLLGACTLAMIMAYWGPVLGAAAALGLMHFPGLDHSHAVAWISMVGLVASGVSYLPTLRFYRRSPLWVLLLPAIGTLYLLMTWSSAARHWRGEGARWKGRSYV